MKTGAWLRGGRGKIAGMVAQKSSDGKGTVLRELVVPKNPQSLDQMATRIAFATVTQAASLMLPIIGQTFKGQSDEILNRRRFVALNVPILKEAAISQSGGGDVEAIFRGKGSNAVIPNAYRISEGSLVLPAQVTPSQVTPQDAIDFPGFLPFTFVNGQSYKPAEVLAKIIGILPSQQLTMVGIYMDSSNENDINYKQESTGDFVRNSKFAAVRYVLNQDAPEFTVSAETTLQQIVGYLEAGFDAEKTSNLAITAFMANMDYENNRLTNDESLSGVTSALFRTYYGNENLQQVALGCILSQLINGAWDYTNSRLAFVCPEGSVEETNSSWYGLSFNNALIDYMGAQARSTLFTRKGGDIDII